MIIPNEDGFDFLIIEMQNFSPSKTKNFCTEQIISLHKDNQVQDIQILLLWLLENSDATVSLIIYLECTQKKKKSTR